MMRPMDRLQPAQGEMGVDLGGGNIGMAQQGLDSPQIGSVLDHMGGATVTHDVRAGARIQSLH
jgi:hypothetical protein